MSERQRIRICTVKSLFLPDVAGTLGTVRQSLNFESVPYEIVQIYI